jgi:hypothetical protein
MRLRSGETFDGMASRTGNPSAAPSMANAMPVFPLVASSKVLPGPSRPSAMAARTMAIAARSFTLPPGLCHSALPSSVIPGSERTTRSSESAECCRFGSPARSPVRFRRIQFALEVTSMSFSGMNQKTTSPFHQEVNDLARKGAATACLRACQNLFEMGKELEAAVDSRPGAQLVRTSPRGATTTACAR